MSKTYHAYTCETGCGHTTIIDKHYKTKRVFCGVCGTKTEMVYQGECYAKKTPLFHNIEPKKLNKYHAYKCETGCGSPTIIDKNCKEKQVFCGVCGEKSEMIKMHDKCIVYVKHNTNILKEKDNVDRLYDELSEKDIPRIMREAKKHPIISNIGVHTLSEHEKEMYKTGASRNNITETIKVQTTDQLKDVYSEDEIKKATEKVNKAIADQLKDFFK